VAWNHVLEQHVELSSYLEETMTTIQAPEHREADPRAGRERYFRRAEAQWPGYGSSRSSVERQIAL
jgi:hypothetical protein